MVDMIHFTIITLLCCFSVLETKATCHYFYEDTCQEECDCQVDKNGQKLCNTCQRPCTKEKDVECFHGECTSYGCSCDSCWQGEYCSNYQNMFPPVFSRGLYTKEVLLYSRGVLRGLAAFDNDRAECSYKKHVLCPCSKIIYGIVKGEDSDKFQINPDTGELAYAANDIGHETELIVIIAAQNIDEFGQVIKSNRDTGYATVRIKVTSSINSKEELLMREILPYPNTFNWRFQEQIIDNEQLYKREVTGNHAHSRTKRAVIINNFDLILINNGSNNAGTMYPSENFTFVAIVTVPVGTYDVKVEINTTLTTSRAVYQITSIDIESIGSNLDTITLPISTETSSFGNNEVDSAVIDFGEVTNNGMDMTTLQLSQLTIIFNLQVIGNSEITDGERYNVTSTVVHTNGSVLDSTSLRADMITLQDIQIDYFTVNVTTTAGVLPFTHPGDTFAFETTLSVPTGSHNFKIVINTTLTTNRAVFKFTSISVTSIGPNLFPATSAVISDVATFGNGEVDIKEIDFGQIDNTGSDMTSIEPSQIVISFTVVVVQNTEVVSGDTYYISAYVEDNGGGVIQSIDSKQLLSNMIPLMVINDFSVLLNTTEGEQPESLTPGDTFIFDVIITVPIGSFDFNVTIASTVTSSRAVLHIFNLVVAAVGTNFNTSITPVFEDTSTFYSFETDSKTIRFDTVTNTGSDITTIQPSQIKLSFTADVIHNVEIKSGAIYNVSVNLNSVFGSKMDMVELISDWSQTFTVFSSSIEISIRDSITTVSPTQQVNFQLIVTVPVGQHNITVHLASAFNGLSIYQICTVESVGLGSNLIDGGNIKLAKVSTYNNFEVDSAAIYLGIIQNSGSNTETSFEPSQVTINFTVIVLNNVNLVDGYMCEFMTSVEEDGVISNTSKLSLPAAIHNLNSGIQPVIQISGPTTLAPGQSAIWTITTVLVDGSSLLSLDIYGTGTYPLDFCSSRFKESGSNFHCYDNNIIKVTPSVTGTTGFVYTFGELLNTDYFENTVSANVNNSVSVEVIASIPTDAALGANFEFSVDAYLNGIGSASEIRTVNVGSPTYSTTIVPVVTMSKFVKSSEDITKGSTVLVVIDMFVEPNSVDVYSLQVTTSVGISTICDVQILSQGENLPCEKITDDSTVYTSLDGNKTFSSVSRELGLVSNLAVSADIMNNDNKITIGVAVQVPLNSSATAGDIIIVTANILSDNIGQVTTSLSMPVTDTIILAETNTSVLMLSLPPTLLPVIVKISETVSWKVQIYFPVTSDRFRITAHTPVSGGEGHLTVISAKYTYIGTSLSCSDFLEILSVSALSDVSNQQMTRLDLDLGFVSYLGLLNTTDENMLEIEFIFKVTDHPGNTDGSVQTITFDLISNSGVVITVTGDVTVSVLGYEMATIQLDTWCDDTFSYPAMSGEDLTIYGNIKLQNTSTAHASNVKFSYLLPHYITFVTLLNTTHVQPVITEDVKGVTLTFPLVTFEDLIEFSFNVSLDPSGWFEPGSVDVYTVLIVDVTYMSLQRPDRTDTDIHYFPEPFILEISFDVLESLVSIGPLLPSCQWFGSSEEKPHTANTSMSSSSLGWRPGVRGEPFCGAEFLEIDLGNKWKVSKLLLFSVGDDNLDYITQFIIQTSQTGITWTSIFDNGTASEKMFNVNFDDNNKQVNDSFDIMLEDNEIFTSRYLRVIPKSATVKTCRPGFRIEVQGVKKTNDYTGNCYTTAIGTKIVEKRTLLVDQIKGTIFACMEAEEGQDVLCSITEDLGQTWEGMDDKVANVIGVIANSSTVLGISEGGISYVCSYDNGFEWNMCSNDEASDIISAQNYTMYKIIPFADLTSLSVGDWKTSYGFTYDNKDITGSISGVIVDAGGSVQTIAWWGTSDWSAEL